MELVDIITDYDRVACIGPTLVANDKVFAFSEKVDQFTHFPGTLNSSGFSKSLEQSCLRSFPTCESRWYFLDPLITPHGPDAIKKQTTKSSFVAVLWSTSDANKTDVLLP